LLSLLRVPDHADIGAATARISMNLQKPQTHREGHRRFIERCLEKIELAKENESLVEFNGFLKTMEEKLQVLETLNEKILSQTYAY
jgi:hypothetical protein